LHPPDEFDLQFRISDDLRPVLEQSDEDTENDPLMRLRDTDSMDRMESATTATTTTTRTTTNHSQQHRQQPPPPEARPLKGYPFVLLHNFNRQAILTERDTWGIPSNVDVFLTRLYQYFFHRGIVPMSCQFLIEITSLLFTLWLSRILLAYVDWPLLATCTEEATCKAHWSDYYRHHSNHPLSWPTYLLIQGYTLLILCYATFQCWSFWHSLMHATTCRTILHEKLGLSERKLQNGALAWDDVVKALAASQASGFYRVVLNNENAERTISSISAAATTTRTKKQKPENETPTANNTSHPQPAAPQSTTSLDPLSVAQRIMRKENFLIAFYNQGLLDVSMGGRQYWCSSLEWSIYNCILNFMFNHKYELRPAFCLDAASLERRLQVCGVVHLLLLPFAILFVTLNFLLRHVYDARSTRKYMGNQQWSQVALWTFREFNELPHMFEQRLEPSYQAGTKYVGLFGTSEWVAAIGKLLVFLGGAVGGVLLMFGILNDAILLHVQLWGRNLLWYAGMAGIVYSVGKALLPTKEATPSVTRNLFQDMDTALKNVSQYTHYYPEHWKGRGWDAGVYNSFKRYFDTKVKLFLWEVAALVLAPYILFFKLSQCAPAICEFCLLSKARMAAGGGDVCGFSTFDFDTFGDEAWEGRTLGKSVMLRQELPSESQNTTHPLAGESLTESIMRTGNLEDATRLHPKPRSREGKMEKSFFTFQAAHPDWRCSSSGQSLVDRVEEYRVAAMTRERELHIEAAARQLETLARLEQSLTMSPHTNQQSQFEEKHLQKSHHLAQHLHKESLDVPPADAGAGMYQHVERSPTTAVQRGNLPIPSLHQAAMAFHNDSTQTYNTRSSTNGGTHHRSAQDNAAPLVSFGGHGTSQQNQAGSDTIHSRRLSPSNAAGLGRSSDIPRLFLSQSAMLEDGVDSTPSPQPQESGFAGDRRVARQYYWLERFHEHLEQQTVEEQQQSQIHQPLASRSMPSPLIMGDPTLDNNNNNNDTPSPRPPTRGTSQDATAKSSLI
jgi:autophagy-related protein 9